MQRDLSLKQEQLKRLEAQYPEVEELANREVELSRQNSFLRAQLEYRGRSLEILDNLDWSGRRQVEASFR